MDRCPSCGADYVPGDRACPGCGVQLAGATASFEAIAETAPQPYPAGTAVSDEPVLIVRKGIEEGERFYLEQPKVTIGRDPESDIFLNDVTVSRSHAVVTVEGSKVRIVDAGSLNGTYVNNRIVTTATLKSGDIVQIGRFQMVFVTGGGA